MKYNVGNYVFVPEKPFSSMEEAVQYIQEKRPELDKETIYKHLTPRVKTDGSSKSNDTIKEDPVSKKVDTKNSSTSPKGIKPFTDKPG